MKKDIKAFWDMLGIDITQKHYYHFWTKNGITYFVQSSGTIADLYAYNTDKKQEWRLDNCWFYINSGYTYTIKETREGTRNDGTTYHYPYKKEIEDRTEKGRLYYRAFYCDFDLTDAQGKHYQGNTLRTKKAALLRDIKEKMPLKPTIVETRNGYHVYLILADNDRFISNRIWDATEKLLIDYMRLYVNQSVDNAVSDGARVLRIPCTYHKKDDSTRTQIKIKQIQNTKYTWAEIFIAFDLASLDAQQQAKKQQAKRTHTHTATNNATSAIKALDADYYDFAPVGKMDYGKARQYILSQELAEFLEIATTDAAFSSPLRKDAHPSASVYCMIDNNTKSPVSLLYDHAEKQAYNIFDVVQTLSGCDNKTAWRFLCSVYGISVKGNQAQAQAQNVDDDIKAHIKAYKAICKARGCEYLKDALPTYKAILKIWKEQTTQQPHIQPYDLFLLVGRTYIKKISKESEKTISRHINALYKLNIIRYTNNEQHNENKKRVNMCKIANLKDADKQTYIRWAKELHDKCNGAVWHNATKKDLERNNFSFDIFDKK